MALRRVDGHRPRLAPDAFVAPSAELSGRVEIGPQASVWYGAVLRGDIEPITVGAMANVQDGCVLHTDAGWPCSVGERVTVGHGAILHGCTVAADALIGMRATVLSGAVIGAGAIVGAGALVTEGQRVPAATLVVGVPARAVRPVRPEEAARVARGVDRYRELAERHRASSEAAD